MSKRFNYIDGDLIAYKASAAAEERTIIAKHVNGSEYSFKNRTAFKEAIPESKRENYTIIDVQTPEPVENIYHTVKVMAQGISERSGCGNDFRLVISGKTNFRDNIPLPTKYKGNRADTLRPIMLNDARQYIQHAMKGIVSKDMEADDVLSIFAYEGFKNGDTIIQSTIDKDATQCQGWLFNWDKMTEPKYIKGAGNLVYEDGKVKGEGIMFLLYQVLHEDQADGYKGSDLANVKFGAKGAFDILSKAKTVKEAFSLVYNQYKTWYPDNVAYTAWDGTAQNKSALEIVEMYWQCARMLRWKGDNLSFEDMLNTFDIPV